MLNGWFDINTQIFLQVIDSSTITEPKNKFVSTCRMITYQCICNVNIIKQE